MIFPTSGNLWSDNKTIKRDDGCRIFYYVINQTTIKIQAYVASFLSLTVQYYPNISTIIICVSHAKINKKKNNIKKTWTEQLSDASVECAHIVIGVKFNDAYCNLRFARTKVHLPFLLFLSDRRYTINNHPLLVMVKCVRAQKIGW